MLRPYKVRAFDLRPHNSQDAVDVIWHDNKRLEFNLRKMKGDLEPRLVNNAPQRGQVYGLVDDLAEETTLPVSADGDEVESALGIIESFEPDGPAVQCRGF